MLVFPELDDADEFRVLGVDTSLRNTGLGVIARRKGHPRAIWHGTVHIPAGRPLSECLSTLHREVTNCLATMKPAAVAVEGVFYHKYARTALLLGQARGVVIGVCASAGIPIFEYEPRRVKQAVTGYGTAAKEQVQTMMQRLLGLDTTPSDDESDALALALCHLHILSGVAALMPDPI